MNELAATLPEYNTVMSMYGVGPTFGPQLMAVYDTLKLPEKSVKNP